MTLEKHDTSGSMENIIVPVKEKYTLTIKEAAAYFNIGIKKMRRIAEDNLGTVAVYCGNRFLIIRPKFEELSLIHQKYNSFYLPKVVAISGE